MSRETFLERWSRLKKVVDQAPAGEIIDAETLLKNLGPDSDFGVFLREEVSEEIRRQAMKKLFADPHYNVMDGLDTYIADYSISDPIPPEMLAGLRQMQDLVSPEDAASESRPLVAETASEPTPQLADAATDPTEESASEAATLAARGESPPPLDPPGACVILASDGQNDAVRLGKNGIADEQSMT